MPHPIRVPKWRRHLRFWRADVQADVDDELRFHFEARAEALRAGGASPDEIARTIAAEFGDLEATRRGLCEIGERVERRRERRWWWHQLGADVAYAVRGLRRAPGFAAAVIVTLALGIGANAAVFSVVDRLLFRAPPLLAEPDRTHRVYVGYPPPQGEAGEYFVLGEMPYARYRHLADGTRSLERAALHAARPMTVGAGEDAPELPVAGVTASFFGFFDASPALGRYFGDAEDLPPRGAPVVVLSHATWQARFAGRDDVLGASVRVGPTVHTVIGVAPGGFVGLWPERPPAAFIPFAAYAAHVTAVDGGARDGTWWTSQSFNLGAMLARRRASVSAKAASADLTAATRREWDAVMADTPLHALAPYAVAASVLDERGPNRTEMGRVAPLAGAMALLVLLVACANVTNLLLARAFRRRREIAVRLTLGVARRRLLAQLLVESVSLALVGGIAGLVVAHWGSAMLRAAFLPAAASTPIVTDVRTLVAVSVAVLAAGVLTGLAPAWQARRVDVARHLRGGARDGAVHTSRARVTLLVTQGALSVLLLVGAGLFVRSLHNARRLRLGFDVAPVLAVELRTRGAGLDRAQAAALRDRLLAAVVRAPGVEHAALASGVPLWRMRVGGGLRVPGHDRASWQRLPDMFVAHVSPGYFVTIGTRIVRGRAIGAQDVAGAPGAIVVSEAMARALWPGTDALGQCVKIGGGETEPCAHVVGVAEDVANVALHGDPRLTYYVAAAQHPARELGLVVRVRGEGTRHAERLRRLLQREMPGASTATVTPLASVVGERTRSWRLGSTLFGTFGGLALALAAVGLYAVMAHDVAQRTHEVGVRVALGAARGDVVWLVVRHGLLVGAVGVALGSAAALAASGRIASLLLDVSPRDPLVYALVAAAMLLVAVTASLVPARRSARVDPVVALRAE